MLSRALQTVARWSSRSPSTVLAFAGGTSTRLPAVTTTASPVPRTLLLRCNSTLSPTLRSNDSNKVDTLARPVYVHQISKTVLTHLQSEQRDWLEEMGLHRGLRLNANGTFVLQFPSRPGFDAGRIWCVRMNQSNELLWFEVVSWLILFCCQLSELTGPAMTL